MSFQAMAWAESPIEGMALEAMRESMNASIVASLAEAEELASDLPVIIPQLKIERYRALFLWGCGVKIYRASGSSIYRNAHEAVAPIVRDATLYHYWGEQ